MVGHFAGRWAVLLATIVCAFLAMKLDTNDCESTLTSGIWNSYPSLWSPPGCFLYPYPDSRAITTCFSKHKSLGTPSKKPQQMIFIGDSTARQVFWGAVNAVDGLNGEGDYSTYLKRGHSNFELEIKVPDASKLVIKFYWDPFFNTTGPKVLQDLQKNGPSVGIIYTSVGLWFSRHMEGKPMEAAYRRALDRVDREYKGLKPKLAPHSLFFGPALYPNVALLNEVRRKTVTPLEVKTLNRMIPSATNLEYPSVFNDFSLNHANEAYDSAGMHFNKKLCHLQAQLIFNLRCNSVLPELVGTQSCCATKGRTSIVIGWLVLVAMAACGVAIVWRDCLGVRLLFCVGACYIVSQGSHVRRELGFATDGVAVVFGIIMCMTSTPNAATTKNLFRGVLILGLILSSFIFRDAQLRAIPFEFGNWLTALVIVERTSEQVQKALEGENHEDLDWYSRFTTDGFELLRAIIEQNTILVIANVVGRTTGTSTEFLRVFPSALQCGLHLSLFTCAAWVSGQVLRWYRRCEDIQYHTEKVYTVSLGAIGCTILASKLFLVLVTMFCAPSVFSWRGLAFLDILALKFGILGGVILSGMNSSGSSAKNKIKTLLKVSILAMILIRLVCHGGVVSLSDAEALQKLQEVFHAIVVLSCVTLIVVSKDIKLSPFPVLERVGMIGRLKWEFIVLIDVVFFGLVRTDPSGITIPRLLYGLKSISPTGSGSFTGLQILSSIALGCCLCESSKAFYTLTLGLRDLSSWASAKNSYSNLWAPSSVNSSSSFALENGTSQSSLLLPLHHDLNE